jgi:Ran GTPase-activating protein (RanGAP) involved in mRNA processing and transport
LDTYKNIRVVNLSDNYIGILGAKQLSMLLTNNYSITSLDISLNAIPNEGVNLILNSLKSNKTLTSLNLGSYNFFSNQEFLDPSNICHPEETGFRIAQFLKTNNVLKELKLSENRIGDIAGVLIAQALISNTTLEYLELWRNKLSISTGKAIGEALKVNNTLTFLGLNYNEMNPGGAKAIANALNFNSALTSLNISGNNIGTSACKVFARSLKQNTTLISLNISENLITDDGISKIFESLSSNSILSYLDIYSNNFSNESIVQLLNVLSHNESLVELNLNYSKISERLRNDLSKTLKLNLQKKYILSKVLDVNLEMIDSVPGEFYGEFFTKQLKFFLNHTSDYKNSDKSMLLMGNTGVGKSTLIYALAAEKLNAISDEETGELIIDAIHFLDNIKISHQMSSETTIPNRCKIGDVIVWDCPGFNDTNVQQEISNSFYIKKLLENNGEIKVVLVIHEGDLIRTKGSNFLNTVERFIKSFSNINHVLESVSFIVNQVAPYKELQHIENIIKKVLKENPNATGEIKTLIEKILSNDSVHIFHKPKDEGIYNYTPIFDALENSGVYVDATPEMANICVSKAAKEYSANLLSSTKGNFDKVIIAIVKAILEPDKCMIIGDKNIFKQNYALIEEWVPEGISYDDASLNAPAASGYFLELKQIKALQDSLEGDITSFDDVMKIFTSVMKTFEEFSYGDDYASNRRVVQEYYKVLEQQCDYIKFFSEICEQNLPDAGEVSHLIKFCKEKLNENMSHKIKTMNLDESIFDFVYYEEAVKYLESQGNVSACKKVKSKICVSLLKC